MSIFGHDPDYGSVFTRMMIKLKPGEAQPRYALDDPPEGYRWETDAELRSRINAAIDTARAKEPK